MEIDKNQVDAYMFDPPVITDQVHKKAQITEVLNIPSFPYERFSDHEGSFVLTTSSSTSQPATKKRRKRKKMRKRFDVFHGREQHDFQIGKIPTVWRIGHGTSRKQPTDLPKSRQMLNMH